MRPTINPEAVSEAPAPAGRNTGLLVLGGVGLLGFLLLAGLGYRLGQRLEALDERLARLEPQVSDSANRSREALQAAQDAAASARAAVEGRQAAELAAREAEQDRQAAEAQSAGARQQAAAARREAEAAREAAARAEAEAQRIRQQAEDEVNRLQQALGQIAETRRTALGVVMNLGGDYLKFEFDKAELRKEDRELLSRIAGVLLTSKDYTVSVNGHTDDVGSAAYNQKLSERRAVAVHDYLVAAGVPPEILSVTGHGKTRPLVPGTSEAARAKNRRVELGIVNTRIIYGRDVERP